MKRVKYSMRGFFMCANTTSEACSGATESWPWVWWAASSSTNSSSRSARS